MARFAFYGRVSTEDQQDPTASRGWQLQRAGQLLGDADSITAEYFDVGQSRSLPWKRRPASAALLEALRDPERGFDAVVIGEPARAFSGNEFSLVFPLLTHYGVELWVPEVGGRVDPASDAHELVMALYGGMSKGERNRIKVRVRSAMGDQARREGRFLGGRPPYGYRLGDAGAHPNPSKAAIGQRLHCLERDDTAAPIVARIFAEYLAGAGLYAIAEGLTRDRVPSPSAHDPARNRHREGKAWSKSAVRAILKNPRYTGRQVWNRQRRDEVLVDVDDVALGHETKLRWNDKADWIWSNDETHEALVSTDDFVKVQEHMAAGVRRPASRKPRTTERPYVLRGLLFCGICGRRMGGQHTHGDAYYRCRYPAEYALANEVDHPRTVYVREDDIVCDLDRWLTTVFDPDNLDETCALLAAASVADDVDAAAIEAARRKLEDCDSRLARYRSALESGADPTIVTQWIAEVQGDRLHAEHAIATASRDAINVDEVRDRILALGPMGPVLEAAKPVKKAELYAGLNLQLTYQPAADLVIAEASLMCATERVGGGIRRLRQLPRSHGSCRSRPKAMCHVSSCRLA
jgi:DNA invertase Pin-like site-specific DNA recombinase